MFKKICAFLCAAAFAVILAVSVSAYTYNVSPSAGKVRNYTKVLSALYEGASEHESKIDISSYTLKKDDLTQIYGDLIRSFPELFYLGDSFEYLATSNGYITAVFPEYTMSKKNMTSAVELYERELGYIVSLVDKDLSDAEKALFVHDYIIASYEYDTSEKSFDVYTMFMTRRGVCEAYSLMYAAVMRELGIDAVVVTSREMNHAWNLVNIGGEWYHVDLVYDDPTPDRVGCVLHENFLLSDSGIKNTPAPHKSWNSAVKCTSKRYESGIWSGVKSRMLVRDDEWFFIDNDKKTLSSVTFGGKYRIDYYTFSDYWYTDDNKYSYWTDVYSGLSDCLGYFFINTPDKLMVFDPKSGSVSRYLSSTDDRYIFGSAIFKNTLEYELSYNPNVSDEKSMAIVERFTIADFSELSRIVVFPFDDVSRIDPYYQSVKYVFDKGLFKGISKTKFAPDATLTRAMFVTVLGRLCDVDTTKYTDSVFSDVPIGQWYSPYVRWASRNAIVNGVGRGKFDPLGEITYEQMLKITALCLRVYGDLDEKGTLREDELLYYDKKDISDWAMDSIVYCAEHGIIENSTDFLSPQRKATRAEAAEIISRAAKLMGID